MKKHFLRHLTPVVSALLLASCSGQAIAPGASSQPAPVQSAVTPQRVTPEVETTIAETIEDEVIVKYRAGFSTQSQRTVSGAEVLDAFNDSNTQLHRLPQGVKLQDALSQYSADPQVDFAIPNVNFKVQMTLKERLKKWFGDDEDEVVVVPQPIPATGTTAQASKPLQIQAMDPLTQSQWYLSAMNMNQVWTDYGVGESSVTVAVLDTGVDYTHPDLAGRIIKGPDYVDRDLDPKDEHGHGTHVAGIITAGLNNQEGISGMAPNVKIMAIRVLDAKGSGSLFNIAKGIAYAANNGAKVINMSLGSPSGGSTMRTLANFLSRYAEARGSLIIAAAGNAGGPIGFPAAASEFLSVGAVNEDKYIASFSNRGKELDVVAPGVQITSTFPTYEVTANQLGLPHDYATLNGTSMATPMVSALAAMLWSQNPYLKPAQVRSRIEDTASDLGAIGVDELYGHGMINPALALKQSAAEVAENSKVQAIQ